MGLALLGPFLAMPLGAGKLTSHDLLGYSEIHQGFGPYGPRYSYATDYNYMKGFALLFWSAVVASHPAVRG